MIEEKIVYVWRHTNGSIIYATDPPLRGHLAGSGSAETISRRIKVILDHGYRLDLDFDPDGNRMPLQDNDRRLFA